MAKLVGAIALSHILAGRSAAQEQAERVFAGMKEVGEHAAGLAADVIVFVTCDHMANFGTDLETPFTVGVGEQYVSLGDMDLPSVPVAGAPEIARGLAKSAALQGFDLAVTRKIRPDHGVMIPRLFVDPKGQTPIVLLNINVNMDPAPSPHRCWKLGKAVGEFIAGWPEDKRFLLVGTGGLSHWILQPQMGRINAEFDRSFMASITSGDAESLSRMSLDELEKETGNGGLELVTWLCVAGAVAPRGGKQVFYEPMEAWLTGLGAVVMNTGEIA